MTTPRARCAFLLGLALCAPELAHAADLPDPPIIPPELMPHCTLDWAKADMSRFEVRDGLVCAGRTCIEEGFYDYYSMKGCGFDKATTDEIFWVRVTHPRKGHARFVALREKIGEQVAQRREAARVATEQVDACLRGHEEIKLLTRDQTQAALTQCSRALEAVKAKSLPDIDPTTLTEAKAALESRMAAPTGAKR